MIRYLEGKENEITKELYSSVFCEDTEGLIDYYYDKKSPGNKIIVDEWENGIVSMIHLCPKKLVINGEVHFINYIFAVATKEEYRGYGIMKQLLLKALADMKDEGFPFTYLIPENENVYKSSGFTTVKNRSTKLKKVYSRPKGIKIRWAGVHDSGNLSDFAREIFSERYSFYLSHDDEYFKNVIEEIKIENGRISMFCDISDNSIIGYSMEYPDGEVREMMFDDKYTNMEYAGSEEKEEKPFLMVRILNLKLFFSLLKTKEKGVCTVKITDDSLFEENNGVFGISFSAQRCAIEKSEKKPECEVTLSKLTAHIFGYEILNGLPEFFLNHEIFINDEI